MFASTRHRIDIEALLRVMVFNRLCDPDSKLGVLRWLKTVSVPGFSVKAIDHPHLLRAMDALIKHQSEVDQVMAGLLRPLLDQDRVVVFYDMTTIRAEGLSPQAGEVRHFGLSKEGRVARPFMLGVVQTAEGIPLYHQVFDGHTAEVTPLKPTIEQILKRFPVKRVIAVADRGLLSTDNLAELQAMPLPDGGMLEFILAVQDDAIRTLWHCCNPFMLPTARMLGTKCMGRPVHGLRLIIAHNPITAAEKGVQRDRRIAELEQQAQPWCGQLDAQDAGIRTRGRKLSDGGAELASTLPCVRPIWAASFGSISVVSGSTIRSTSTPCARPV